MNLKISIFFSFIFFFVNIESKEKFALITDSKNTFSIIVNLAETISTKERGLMNVDKLTNSNGMLFLYSKPKILNFWMKNTYIDLDIIFIGKEKKILNIKKGFKLSKSIISSEIPAIAVLELPINCSKKIGIYKGLILSWKKIENKNLKKILKKDINFLPCIK